MKTVTHFVTSCSIEQKYDYKTSSEQPTQQA